MATPAQISANRQNAVLSTGPRTCEGKSRVAQNRLQHGLTGWHVVLPDENPAEYDLLLAGFSADLRPAGPMQCFLVEQIAQAEGRLVRIARLAAEIFQPLRRRGRGPPARKRRKHGITNQTQFVRQVAQPRL